MCSEMTCDTSGKGAFPRMPEGRVADVVPEGDRFGEVLVQGEGTGNRPGYLSYLQGMGQTRAVMIPCWRQKHLCFVLESAE